jgi:uncharacterized RDD family membrane protein YckC
LNTYNFTSLDPPHIADTLPSARSVSPVWRRFVAYAVDGAILGILGDTVGRVCFDKLAQLGLWGPLAGFCVALVYFASFDSEIGNGQTFGKRWLKVRVIDAKGNTIPFAKSLVRSVIFLVPSFLFGLRLPETRTSWVLSSLIFVVVLWVGCSTLYLITFHQQTRQGLHDLAAGSYVGSADVAGPVGIKPILKAQWVTLLALLVIVSALAGIVSVKLEMMEPFPRMRHDALLIEQMGGILRAHLSDSLAHDSIGGGAKKDLDVNITLQSNSINQEAFADEVARTILQNDRNSQNYDQLSIRIFYGYDIGIAARWNHQEFAHSPAEWRQRAGGISPVQSPSSTHQ